MTEIHNLQRIAVAEELAANFGTDLSGSATFYDIPFKEGSATLTLNHNFLDPQTAQQYHDGYASQIQGPVGATLNLTMPLHALGSASDDSTAALGKTDAGLLMLLALTWGGIRSGDMGSTIDGAGSTTTVIDVATGEGSRFEAGCAVGLLSGDNGELEVREVASVSTDEITLKQPLSNAPSASDAVYNATTIYPKDNPTSCLQFIAEGATTTDRWTLISGQCTTPPSVTRSNGTIPEITFAFEFADFAAGSTTAITPATYSNYTPIYVHGEAAFEYSSALQVIDASQVNYSFNSPVYQKVSSPGGVNAISAWRRSRAVPFVEVDLVGPRTGTTALTLMGSLGTTHVQDQIGRTAGQSITITVPTCQMTDLQPLDEGGLAYESTKFRAGLDTATGAQTTELLRAPARIHFI